MPIQVMLADDHQIIRQSLKVLLEREGLKIVGEASNGQEAVKIAESCERLLHEFRRQMGLTPRSRDVVKPLQRQREDARSSPVLAILKKAEALVQ